MLALLLVTAVSGCARRTPQQPGVYIGVGSGVGAYP